MLLYSLSNPQVFDSLFLGSQHTISSPVKGEYGPQRSHHEQRPKYSISTTPNPTHTPIKNLKKVLKKVIYYYLLTLTTLTTHPQNATPNHPPHPPERRRSRPPHLHPFFLQHHGLHPLLQRHGVNPRETLPLRLDRLLRQKRLHLQRRSLWRAPQDRRRRLL